MGKPGPKTKPTRVKELQGNPGKRKLNKREVKPSTEKPRVPTGMPYEEAQKLYRKIGETLHSVGLLTKADGPAMTMMTIHYAVAMEAAKDLEENGITTFNERGAKVKNPTATIFNQNSMAFRRYATEFGMTPSSRAGLETPQEGEQMTLADALFDLASQLTDDDPEERNG